MPSLLGIGSGVHYKVCKTVHQSFKHKVNRCVFELALKRMQVRKGRRSKENGQGRSEERE